MPYKNSEAQREWERDHRAQRNKRKREVRALEGLILEQVAQRGPNLSASSKRELLQRAREEGLYSRRNLKLRIDAGLVSVAVPGDALGRALSRAIRWLRSK